jgi:hypothetical protein
MAPALGEEPTTLLRFYAHLLSRSDAQAAEALAAVLDDKALTHAPESAPQTLLKPFTARRAYLWAS